MRSKSEKTIPAPRQPFASTVPPPPPKSRWPPRTGSGAACSTGSSAEGSSVREPALGSWKPAVAPPTPSKRHLPWRRRASSRSRLLARASHPAHASSANSSSELEPHRAVAGRPGLQSPAGTARPVERLSERRADGRLVIVAAGTTWYAARAGGILAYLLLSASVAVGLLLSGRARLPQWPRFALEDVHAFLGFLAGTFIVVHGGALLLDHVVPFSLSQLIVPGRRGLPAARRRLRRGRAPSCSPRSRSPTTTASACRTGSGAACTCSISPSGAWHSPTA